MPRQSENWFKYFMTIPKPQFHAFTECWIFYLLARRHMSDWNLYGHNVKSRSLGHYSITDHSTLCSMMKLLIARGGNIAQCCMNQRSLHCCGIVNDIRYASAIEFYICLLPSTSYFPIYNLHKMLSRISPNSTNTNFCIFHANWGRNLLLPGGELLSELFLQISASML